MRVTIKSFVPPNEPIEGFRLGEPFKIDLGGDATVGDVMQTIFSKHTKRIGIMAVNGKIADETTALSEGDRIDLYPLLEGGDRIFSERRSSDGAGPGGFRERSEGPF